MARESQVNGSDSPTRERILAAALELFGTHGFQATPIREIARVVGITDAAVLHHFGSKRAILNALWTQSGRRQLDPRQLTQIRTPDEVAAAALEVLDSSRDNFRFSRLLTHQALAGDEQASASRTAARERWRAVLRKRFASFSAEDAEVLADAFATSVSGYMWLAQATLGSCYAEQVNDPEFRARFVAVVLRSCPVERFIPLDGQAE